MRGVLEDTICAIATPSGEGGIGIVRLSGLQALAVAGRIVRLRSGAPLSSLATHTLHLADLVLPSSSHKRSSPRAGALLDEALVVYMKGPRSFTGEDVVEIQSHGGPLVLGALCDACIGAGARMAEPGEFTKRAFLNGRLDLSQAEAVLDTIRAKSEAGLTAAQRQLRGELGREVEGARAVLLMVLAQLEAGIDFAGEDITVLEHEELVRAISQAASIIQRLESTATQGRILRDGARVVILGRPNVGKSSLMNRLLKEDRAIVTDIPGTTRDVIEEGLDMAGVMVRLVDTAGIRETVDTVEREGIKRTLSALEDADLCLVVLDGSVPLTQADHDLVKTVADRKHLVLINKSDLPSMIDAEAAEFRGPRFLVSAKSGVGLDELRTAIRAMLVSSGGDASEGIVVTNVRHRTALRRAAESLQQTWEASRHGLAGELIAVDLRAAADALGEITGVITTDEILERIFSEFCIGK